jgi:hypothetical protein
MHQARSKFNLAGTSYPSLRRTWCGMWGEATDLDKRFSCEEILRRPEINCIKWSSCAAVFRFQLTLKKEKEKKKDGGKKIRSSSKIYDRYSNTRLVVWIKPSSWFMSQVSRAA